MSKNPDNPNDELVKRMADKMVELGYAVRVLSDDSRRFTDVVWTPMGASLKSELQKIHKAIAQNRGEIGQAEMIAFLGLFIFAPDPKLPYES